MQRSRTDVLPLTWEIPAALGAGWCLLAVLALPAGQGLACALSGHGFVWPHGGLVESVLGLASGRTGQGLTRSQVADIPSRSAVHAAIALVELTLGMLVFYGFTLWWRTVGPGAQFGLATAPDVRRVLGPGHLRRRRSTIRPDLHVPHRPPQTQRDET